MTAKFRTFPDDYLSSPDNAEQRVLAFWAKANVFGEQQKRHLDRKPFVFFEGPPTANGKPGIHHVFARAIKDTVCRYQWMMGARVERKAGWDTHGLPVELEVEKKLGISGKRQIEQIAGSKEESIAKFNELCKESVFTYLTQWRELSERMGYWLDYDHPYVTFEPRYIESVWWLFSRFHANGLLEKRFKVIPYCPRCGTGLSSHEVGQGYKDIQDPSVTVRFPLVSDPSTSLLVWTTTPWTLPSNAGAAVHPEMEYVKVKSPKHAGEQFWLLKTRLEAVIPNAEVLETKQGRELAGLQYSPPFTLAHVPDLRPDATKVNKQKIHTVLTGEFVTSEDGTGIVHMAPCYGADDYELGEREGLPIYAAVGRDGKLAIDVGRAEKGTFFKDADAALMTELKENGKLFARSTTQHSYPFCWRCDTALLYYASPSWFLKTTAYSEKMVAKNREIRWAPPEIGSGRFGEWLEGNIDWAVSRDRYWGTPLPVWECEECKTFDVIDSIETLRKRATTPVPELFDPHKPAIDHIKIKCNKCNREMERSPSVVDCWFDSGAMPFAQFGYPFTEEARKHVADQFPANFIAEGLDQTRGWFYTLHAIATFLTCYDKDRKYQNNALPLPAASAYRACVVNGLVLDAMGQKMSKRLGNAVNPFLAMQQNGADSVRLLLLGSGALHLNRRFDPDSMSSIRRQVILPLANCLQFFATYANEANFDISRPVARESLTLLDRWIRSRAFSLAKEVGECFENFDLPGAVSAIGNFAEAELSNWYVRRNRKRFQLGAGDDLAAGLNTLRDVLGVAARCLAPLAPFASEMLWHRLHPEGQDPESVHLQQFPSLEMARKADLNSDLEESMHAVLIATKLSRAIREKNKIRNTIPLANVNVIVYASPELSAAQLEKYKELSALLAEEANVDAALFAGQSASPAKLKGKPNFPVLGKRAGKKMKLIQSAIESMDSNSLQILSSGGGVSIIIEGEAFRLDPNDVTITSEAVMGLVNEKESNIEVFMNIEIDDVRRSRAFAREVASAVNQARRDAQFRLSDRCRISVVGSDAARRVISGIEFQNGMARWLDDLRASAIEIANNDGGPWQKAELLDGESIEFRIAKV
ncbi:MAG: isoleucine--tRNA ligase [Planctomycetota bacterium]